MAEILRSDSRDYEVGSTAKYLKAVRRLKPKTAAIY
jgi:hypothetical protein